MDQIKIGKFIAECRKENNLTQMQLAERLNITDRAISKWENGKGMPDSSIMIDLCNELKISVNELLSGERIEMKEYNKKAEENLFELNKSNEKKNKIINYIVIITIVLIIISVVELFFVIIQLKKVQLETTLNQAQNTYELNIKVNDLEERLKKLEENN
ncbi:MAG: helix-turn-helix transcriptional regulator [Bacilli bacterium]|nr:helix-turn-helix transcriptional regulator [Bacilli bacterium]